MYADYFIPGRVLRLRHLTTHDRRRLSKLNTNEKKENESIKDYMYLGKDPTNEDCTTVCDWVGYAPRGVTSNGNKPLVLAKQKWVFHSVEGRGVWVNPVHV